MATPTQIRDLHHAKHLFVGVFGWPNAGKTNLIATGANTLIIRPPIEHTDGILKAAPNVKEWVVRDWKEMTDDVLEYLRHEGAKWDFVWLDSISGWQDVGLDDIWADVIARKPHRKEHSLDKGEFGINMNRLSQFVRGCVGCDQFNFGFTAWPEELSDEEGNTRLMPWVQGKNMSTKMCGMMKLVCYMERVKKKDGSYVRVLRWAENEDYYTKNQVHLPSDGKLINPTMPKLLDLVEQHRPGKTSTTTTTARRRPRRTAGKKKGS
jgi:hypothetical protein